jgi:invasion protein IalB
MKSIKRSLTVALVVGGLSSVCGMVAVGDDASSQAGTVESTTQSDGEISQSNQLPKTGVGPQKIGAWTLMCNSPKDPPDNPLFGPCRLVQTLRDNDHQIVLDLNLRLMRQSVLTVIVQRSQHTSYGDLSPRSTLMLLFTGGKGVPLPIARCKNSNCVAIAGLGPSAEALVESSDIVAVTLPAPNTVQSDVYIHLDGLKEAVAALRSTDVAEQHVSAPKTP